MLEDEQTLGQGPEVALPVAVPNDVRGTERWLKRIAIGTVVITALSVVGLLSIKEQNPLLFHLGKTAAFMLDGAILASFLANMGIAKIMRKSLAEMLSEPLFPSETQKGRVLLFAGANIFGPALGMIGGPLLSTLFR